VEEIQGDLVGSEGAQAQFDVLPEPLRTVIDSPVGLVDAEMAALRRDRRVVAATQSFGNEPLVVRLVVSSRIRPCCVEDANSGVVGSSDRLHRRVVIALVGDREVGTTERNSLSEIRRHLPEPRVRRPRCRQALVRPSHARGFRSQWARVSFTSPCILSAVPAAHRRQRKAISGRRTPAASRRGRDTQPPSPTNHRCCPE
jgi:hypothetical protein